MKPVKVFTTSGKVKPFWNLYRFWSKVHKTPGCWEWTANRVEKGYGNFKLGGKIQKAHRVSWALKNGPIPKGLHVLHKCDNPPCVRHKVLIGEAVAGSKLREEDIRVIRFLANFLTQKRIAEIYGVYILTIHFILKGKNWKHVR